MTAADGTWQPARFSRTSKRRTAQLSDGSEVMLASSGERLGARVIDFGIAAGFLWIGLWLSFASWDIDNTDEPLGKSLLFPLFPALQLVLLVIYRMLATALWGQTLGKRALSIRVVDRTTGRRIRWRQAFARTIIPLAGGLISLAGLYFWFVSGIVGGSTGTAVFFLVAGLVGTCLCYLSITWHAQRQGWHDRAARSLVIRLP